ncbi:staygreen family protein [Neobacillus drentensis]|uniref:staygreen family protein n=1 Tax=Neobacillus drentensis TaxID=220684 RepID=UPI002FFE1E06
MEGLTKFIPEKLSVEFKDGVTVSESIFPRYYTLTHSDVTGQLFLSIGKRYAWDKINPLRDEVLGEWKTNGHSLSYCVYLYIDQGQFNQNAAAKRMEIFRRELPLALTAIRYGDRLLFEAYPNLDHASILVHFISAYPQFARQENWGNFGRFSKL